VAPRAEKLFEAEATLVDELIAGTHYRLLHPNLSLR